MKSLEIMYTLPAAAHEVTLALKPLGFPKIT